MIWQRPDYSKPITPEMIESQAILPNGVRFTKVKPGIADGAETAEMWSHMYLGKRRLY